MHQSGFQRIHDVFLRQTAAAARQIRKAAKFHVEYCHR